MPVRYYPLIDACSPARRRAIFAAIYIFFALVMVGFTMLTCTFYLSEGRKSKENVAVFNDAVDSDGELISATQPAASNISSKFLAAAVNANAPSVGIEIMVLDVDPVRSSIKLNSKFRRREAEIPENATLMLGSYKTVPLSSASYYIEQDIVLVTDGDPNHYPFDVHVVQIPYAVTVGDALSSPNATAIPASLYAFGVMQNYRFNMTFETAPNSSMVMLTVQIRRAPSTKGFAIFIVIIMWILTLSACSIAFQAFLRMRDVAPPLLGVFVSLLFALPAMRNTMPSVPPIGTLLDTIGLFWNMALVACSCITVMAIYVLQGPIPKPPNDQRSEKTLFA